MTPPVRRDFAGAPLWASAFVILALILVVAGRSPVAEPALAISNDRVADLTAVTFNDGSEHDVVVVVDRVKGLALVYSMQNRRTLELHQAEPIERLFSQARAAASSQRGTP